MCAIVAVTCRIVLSVREKRRCPHHPAKPLITAYNKLNSTSHLNME